MMIFTHLLEAAVEVAAHEGVVLVVPVADALFCGSMANDGGVSQIPWVPATSGPSIPASLSPNAPGSRCWG